MKESESDESNKKKDFINTSKEMIIDPFKETIKERISSPFYATFLLTFTLFNWKSFAILLFSNNPIEYRIFYIQECFAEKLPFIPFEIPWVGVWFPLIVAFAYEPLTISIRRLQYLLSKDSEIKNIEAFYSIELTRSTEQAKIQKNRLDILTDNNYEKTIENLQYQLQEKNDTINSIKETHKQQLNELERRASMLTFSNDKLTNTIEELEKHRNKIETKIQTLV